MSEHRNATGGVAERESLATSVEIEVQNRWDALALTEALIPYHSFLVEFGCQRWVVHARVPGTHGEPLDGALAKIKQWHAERRLEDVSCRVGDRPYGLNESRAALCDCSAFLS